MPIVTQAQSVGSHIRRSSDSPRDLRTNDPASVERAANAFARCVADRRSGAARSVLALAYGSEEQGERMQRLVSGGEECMNNIGFLLHVDNARIVGGMAEHFLRAVYSEDDVAAVGSLTSEQMASEELVPRNAFESLGLCVARRTPSGVHGFVTTEVGSDDELAAAQALSSEIGPCVVQGTTLEFSVPMLRSTLATGLYRATAYAAEHAPMVEASE
ncbi:hypothetical protein [Parvibaculum sp.]|uniref:hypothetical protein n=1 Tax=Parvibaculum sp. TaxID=2024848 RepID=UPI0032EFA33C